MKTNPSPRAIAAEVLLLLAVLTAFSWLHTEVVRDPAAATAHALDLQSTERTLRVNIELPVNMWLSQQQVLSAVAATIYRVYYLPLLAVLVWLFLRHPACYQRSRRVLIAMSGIGLLAFWVFPVSPPRFALTGIVDIIADHDILSVHQSVDRTSSANLTAFPSLHVGWAAWCAYAVWSTCRRTHPRQAALAWLFPMLMTAVVLTTGAHYVLDVIGSAALLLASIGAATGGSRILDQLRRTPATRPAPPHDST